MYFFLFLNVYVYMLYTHSVTHLCVHRYMRVRVCELALIKNEILSSSNVES